MKILPPVSIEARRLLPSRWDLLAAVLVLGFIIAFADASRYLVHPLSTITGHDLKLNIWDLPGYAVRTGLRMLLALGVSLAFTFTYATWGGQKSPGRQSSGAFAGYPAIGADPGLPVGDGGVVPLALARKGVRRRAGLCLRHFHRPGLEYGLQFLPVAAHSAAGA